VQVIDGQDMISRTPKRHAAFTPLEGSSFREELDMSVPYDAFQSHCLVTLNLVDQIVLWRTAHLGDPCQIKASAVAMAACKCAGTVRQQLRSSRKVKQARRFAEQNRSKSSSQVYALVDAGHVVVT
jgi:hypothetical protein